ncbi:MAG: ComEC/Rec2 family competence protein [Bacteroidota bacterium]|nr:ComEC/Rec2 family competence protein [Bacteroidota bacterium]
MRNSYHIFIWKKAPFLRLLILVVFGILFQFYFTIPINIITVSAIFLFLAFCIFSFLPEAIRFRFKVVQGILISLFLISFGSLITWQKDVRNQSGWYGNYIDSGSFLVAMINEPPVEKAKSFKALASVEIVINKKVQRKSIGKALFYFAKDSVSEKLKYGDKIIFKNPLKAIKNSGNPGAFDYEQYCAFQQIFHQVYLKNDQWKILNGNNAGNYKTVIFTTRNYILQALEKYIPGTDESSLAKALLIGYRVDLDKDLVQAYSNVGVVHLIAISGMHLALIYYFLLWIFARIPVIKKSKLTRLILVLFCMWFFSLLTGAPASVIRSAVMFTFVAIGDSFERKNSVFNSLAISAFILLCYDPFMLWDVGFELSYLAVLGIVIFQKNIYNWFHFKNEIFNSGWKLASVSLAAQLLTLPVCIYYFHQLPLLFLLSNMIAIPLSTVALWGCIAIVAISPIPFAALYSGKLVRLSIWLLNHSVLLINRIPFSLWHGLFISKTATILLYLIFLSFLHCLIKKNKATLKIGIATTLLFISMMAYKNWKTVHQKIMIVYNIPMNKAIDFIYGNKYYFIGDSTLIKNHLLVNYNLKPARISFRAMQNAPLLNNLFVKNNFYQFNDCRILMIETTLAYVPTSHKIDLDYIIISKNPKIKIASLEENFNCKEYIFDASNPTWKIEQWKKECEELHLHFHSVTEQGAFVINL